MGSRLDQHHLLTGPEYKLVHLGWSISEVSISFANLSLAQRMGSTPKHHSINCFQSLHILMTLFFLKCIFLSRQSPCPLLGESELAVLVARNWGQSGQELRSKEFHNWDTIFQLSNQLLSNVPGWNRPTIGQQMQRTSYVPSWVQSKPCPFQSEI